MPQLEQIRDGQVPAGMAATYVELRHAFDAREVPAVLRALAPLPSALSRSWRALGPNVKTAVFEAQARSLHAHAVRAAVELGTPLLEPVLTAAGLDVDALDELREEVRRLETVETRAWLFAAGLFRWLAGEGLLGRHVATAQRRHRSGAAAIDSLLELHPVGVAAELVEKLRGPLHLPEPTRLLRHLARSEAALASVVDGLEPVLQHRAFGGTALWLAHEARVRWDRMPYDVEPFDSDSEPSDVARWRHVAALFEDAGARHGLFAAALRVGLDGAEDALETEPEDEPLH